MEGEGPRQDYYIFAHRALLGSVLNNLQAFLDTMASTNASEALTGLWTHVQETLEMPPSVPPGLSGCARNLPGGIRLGLVRLPKPAAPTECYFVAVVVEPGFRYVTLEHAVHLDGSEGTMLCEWTQHGGELTHANYGDGPPPDEDEFLKAVQKLLETPQEPDASVGISDGSVPCEVCGKPGRAVQDPRGGPFSVSLCPQHESGEGLGTRIHCGCLVLIGLIVIVAAVLLWWLVL
jgi:hypothetical protein